MINDSICWRNHNQNNGISYEKLTKNRWYDWFFKKNKFFSKKVLTKEESFGKIILADAPQGTNRKGQTQRMQRQKTNLDNWTVKQPWKFKKRDEGKSFIDPDGLSES